MIHLCGAALFALAIMGCGRSPGTPDPLTPPSIGANARCAALVPSADEGAEDVDERRKPVPCEHQGVTYVPLDAWTPSARVRHLEANMRTREQAGSAGLMTFPKLTLHREIPGTTYYRGGRRRWR